MKSIILLGSALVAALAAAGPARAGYIVSATAQSNTSGYVYKRGYNASQAFGAVGGPGFTQQLYCPASNQGQACAYTGSGTTDTIGNAKSAFEQTTISSTYPPNPNFGIPMRSAAGNAYARADLKTGKLGVSMGGTYGLASLGVPGGAGVADAYLSDMLRFHVANFDPNKLPSIGLTFSVDGQIVGVPGGDAYANLDTAFAFGSGNFDGSIYDTSANGYMPTLTTYNIGGWTSEYISPAGADHFIFHATYALTQPTVDLGVFERLAGHCNGPLSCDYSHTGAITFQLPTGVTYTSDSGVFLTGHSTSVPEPSALALLAAGVGGLAMGTRRRR